MSLIQIYQCLCDPTRLRILALLQEGELCVCHFQEILGESQVKVSKHLAYLRSHEMVETRKEANWVVYRLPSRPSRQLTTNLACLQDCTEEDPVFRLDRARRRQLESNFSDTSPVCCPPRKPKTKSVAVTK